MKHGKTMLSVMVAATFGVWGAGEARAQVVAGDVVCTGCVGTTDLATGAVATSKLKAGAVTSQKVKDESLTGADILNGSVAGADIQDGSIGIEDLAAGAVGPAQIADGAVTGAKIAPGAVGSAEVGDGALSPADVGFNYAGSVGKGGPANDLVCPGCVGNLDIAGGAVDSFAILNGSIVGADINGGADLVVGSLAATGSLAVGTTSPVSRLQVSGSETAPHGFQAAMTLENTAAGGRKWYLRSGATGTVTPAGGFSIADDVTYRFAVDQAGKVGIGTAAPTMSLDVVTPSLYDRPAIGGTYGSGWAYLHVNDLFSDHALVWNIGSEMRFGSETAKGSGFAEVMKLHPGGYAYIQSAVITGVDNHDGCDLILADDICFRDFQNGRLSVRTANDFSWAGVEASGFFNVSTMREKKRINRLAKEDYDRILERMTMLDVVNFLYTNEPDQRHAHIGLLAEESPREILNEEGDAINLSDYAGFLLAGLKAQQAEIEELKQEISDLEALRAQVRELNDLKEQVGELRGLLGTDVARR